VPETDVNELMSALVRQAEVERERIAAETRKAIEETLKGAEAEAVRLLESAERELEREMASEKDRILGRLRMEEGKRRLLLKREVLRKVFERARERISKRYGSEEYPRVLKRLIGEALSALGENGDLVVSSKDLELCSPLVAQMGSTCTIRGEGEEPGTVIALSSDGARKVDNSLSTRLERARVVLEPEVSRLLFGDSIGESYT
jgi:V/A-type H+/Na+-transporting ATPase subunit E